MDNEEALCRLKQLTLKSEKQIIEIMQGLPCTYQFALSFYEVAGRFPYASEFVLPGQMIRHLFALKRPPLAGARLVFEQAKMKFRNLL